MKKINLMIVFGGKSSEHSVSIWSAENIINTIDKSKYILSLIYIDKKGNWYKLPNNFKIEEKEINANLKKFSNVCLCLKDSKGHIFDLKNKTSKIVDVCFPIMHGLNGEDGAIQGLLQMHNIKCVGPSMLSSSINMDKDLSKKILKYFNIKVAEFVSFKKHEIKSWSFEKVKKTLGAPFCVKPANNGSSIGISKVRNKDEYILALKNAFQYDKKIIIEKCIFGREIECSLIGNTEVFASIPGEIIPEDNFYSYSRKYLKNNTTRLIIPADLSKKQVKQVQSFAISAYKALECSGFSRVDMFLTKNGDLYLNEINTIPGFTSISMFPKLWEASNLDQKKLINLIIQLALKN